MTYSQIENRIDELINDNLEIIENNKKAAQELTKDGDETAQRDFELLEQRLLGGNSAFLEVKFLIKFWGVKMFILTILFIIILILQFLTYLRRF